MMDQKKHTHTNTISGTLDSNQIKEQAGFRSAFSTMDHIQTVNQVAEKINEDRKELHLAFTDYEKTNDSVKTVAVINVIWQQGTGEIYCKSLKINAKMEHGLLDFIQILEKFQWKRS